MATHGHHGIRRGALIGAPLSIMLMDHFKTPASTGVMESFVTMASFTSLHDDRRDHGPVPRPIGSPTVGPSDKLRRLVTTATSGGLGLGHAAVLAALGVLCMNVTAGIGVLSQASPMIQNLQRGSPVGRGGIRRPAEPFQPGRPVFLASVRTTSAARTYMVFFLLAWAVFGGACSAT